MVRERNKRIDNLRALGMVLIILAHCDAPSWINNIRSFDVILLVFISQLVVNDPFRNKDFSYSRYVSKRAKRLLLPTYIFIFTYSIFLFLVYYVAHRMDLLGIKQIVNTVLLCEDSIGYVWVVKVFFLNAVILPIILFITYKTNSNIVHCVIITSIFAVYYIILVIYKTYLKNHYISWIIIEQWILCCLAYSLVAIEAEWCKKKKLWIKKSWIIWSAIVVLTVLSYGYFNPASGKRPVNLQYMAYGIACSELLYVITPKKSIRIIEWISKHSFDIYFVHPFFILAFKILSSGLGIKQIRRDTYSGCYKLHPVNT